MRVLSLLRMASGSSAIALAIEQALALRPNRLGPTSSCSSSRLLKKSALRPIFSMFATATNEGMGGDPHTMRGNRYDIASYTTLQTDSSRCGQNPRDAKEVVGGCRQHE